MARRMHERPAQTLLTKTSARLSILLLVALATNAGAACLVGNTTTLAAWEGSLTGTSHVMLSCLNIADATFLAPRVNAFALPILSQLQLGAAQPGQPPPLTLQNATMHTDCETVWQYQQYICRLPLADLAGAVEISSPHWMFIYEWSSEVVRSEGVNMTCVPPAGKPVDSALGDRPPCLVTGVRNATALMAAVDWLQRSQGLPAAQALKVLVVVLQDITFLETDVSPYWPEGLNINANVTVAAPLALGAVADLNDLVNIFKITTAPNAYLTLFGMTFINLPTYFFPDLTSRLHLYGMLQSAYWFVNRRNAAPAQLTLQSSTFVIAYDSFAFWVYWLTLKNSPDPNVAALASWAPLTTLNLNEADTGHLRLVETYSATTSWINMSMANPMVHPVKRRMIGLPSITDSFTTPTTAMCMISSMDDIVIAVKNTIGDLWTRQYGQKIIFSANVSGNSTTSMYPKATIPLPPRQQLMYPSAPPPPPPPPFVQQNSTRPVVLQVPTTLTVWPGTAACWDMQLDTQLLAHTTSTPISVDQLSLMNLPATPGLGSDASLSLASGLWSFGLIADSPANRPYIKLNNLTMQVPPAELQLYFSAASLVPPEAAHGFLNLSTRGRSLMKLWITSSNVSSYGPNWILFTSLNTGRFQATNVNLTDAVPPTCGGSIVMPMSVSYALYTTDPVVTSADSGLPGWAIGLIAGLGGAAVLVLVLVVLLVVARRRAMSRLPSSTRSGSSLKYLLSSLSGGSRPALAINSGDQLLIHTAGGVVAVGGPCKSEGQASSHRSALMGAAQKALFADSFSNMFDCNMIDGASSTEGTERLDPETLINRLARQNSGLPDEQLEILGVLGRGGFGIVYRGLWKGLPVAAKVMIVHEENHESAQSQMLEAMISTSLSHPNIVSTYKYDLKRLSATPDAISFPSMARPGSGSGQGVELFGASAWQLLILQELCVGGTLRQMIDQDALSMDMLGNGVRTPMVARVVQLALDIALGLQHLHHKNVVHADLTPKNVLLQTSAAPRLDGLRWVAKVADFGLSVACEAGRSHVSRRFAGTPFYIAPETQNEGIVSKQSDVFALGILLSEMMMGPLKPVKRPRASMGSSSDAHVRHIASGDHNSCCATSTAHGAASLTSHRPIRPGSGGGAASGISSANALQPAALPLTQDEPTLSSQVVSHAAIPPAPPATARKASFEQPHMSSGTREAGGRLSGRGGIAGESVRTSLDVVPPHATVVMSLTVSEDKLSDKGGVDDDHHASSTHSSVLGSARASLPLPSSCPAQYAALVTECLNLIPSRRPSVAAVVQALRALVQEYGGGCSGLSSELSFGSSVATTGLVSAGPSIGMLPTLNE